VQVAVCDVVFDAVVCRVSAREHLHQYACAIVFIATCVAACVAACVAVCDAVDC